ncbi:MAG: TIGR03790 family protein [Acidobacteriota bacterium]
MVCSQAAWGQAGGPANVLVVVNDASPVSRSIGEYYARRRSIPSDHVCHIRTEAVENIERDVYTRNVARPITGCLQRGALAEQILYIVTTMGVPLKIDGSDGMSGDMASVDSELTLLYGDIRAAKAGAKPHALNGPLKNPMFGRLGAAFTHAEFPMYLVTRLAAYDLAGVKNLIDQALLARNQGKFVIDMKSKTNEEGNDWLRKAAQSLPADRVIFDESEMVLYDQTDVIGFASWGSNDPNRHERFVNFKWLPGSIATEFVSTNARTFERPPNDWTIAPWAAGSGKWWKGSPQTLTADYLSDGATAATGHVDEPFLVLTPHPEYLLPAYFTGRNLAESFYLSIQGLSWQNVVIGDPLMTLAK